MTDATHTRESELREIWAQSCEKYGLNTRADNVRAASCGSLIADSPETEAALDAMRRISASSSDITPKMELFLKTIMECAEDNMPDDCYIIAKEALRKLESVNAITTNEVDEAKLEKAMDGFDKQNWLAVSTPIPLTPSDGKAVPTEAEWLAFLKANETMHCPVCGSNKRKPNGGAACDCNVTWVVDTPSSKPITPSDEMVEAGAKATFEAMQKRFNTGKIYNIRADELTSQPWERQPAIYRNIERFRALTAIQAALNLMGGKK